jgi:hypothetical protein
MEVLLMTRYWKETRLQQYNDSLLKITHHYCHGNKQDCSKKDTRMASISTTTLAEQDMNGRVILDVIVPQSASVLQQLASKDDELLYGASASPSHRSSP